MRRSICYTEPGIALAGQTGTWKFHYTTATSLPEGTRVKFDLLSMGRDIDWEIPSVDLSVDANVIYLELEDGEILEFEEVETPEGLVPQYETTLPYSIKVGGIFTIALGIPPDLDGDESEYGTESQLMIQRRRPFNLYIDPKGKGNYEDPQIFTLDVRGNKLDHIRILTPSFVAKNKRFDITVRFEDEYDNLTHLAPEETLIDLSYEHLRENLNWKLFVPETGFVILPNLYFNEAGIYRIQLRNLHTKEHFLSAPIKCFQENDRGLFWGLLHGESERVDSTENIENCLRHFRDEKALNFFATSPFDQDSETTQEVWKSLSHNISEFNEEDRFATFLGSQYVGEPGKEGVRQLLFSKEGKGIVRQKDAKHSCLTKIYKTWMPKDLLSIPTFTMGKGFHFDFKDFNPEFERVVEIYNAWGSSEKSAGDRPLSGPVKPHAEGSLVEALKKNCRFGFVAGGLDDRGIYHDFYDSEQAQYSPGLTGIVSNKYAKESMFEALTNRSCYATTGARIIVGFHVAGHPMGSELSTTSKPGLLVNRHLSGYVAGTDALDRIELIRNGEVLHTIHPEGYHHDFYFDDMDPLEKVTLTPKGSAPFVFYYVRVYQKDGHLAWGSPIWVDVGTTAPQKSKKNG